MAKQWQNSAKSVISLIPGESWFNSRTNFHHEIIFGYCHWRIKRSKNGRNFLENFRKDFWLDLKINDIPQTALSALDSLKDLKKCKYITVHANGGLEMLKVIKKKAK